MDRRGTARAAVLVRESVSPGDRLTTIVTETRGRVAQLVERVDAVAHFTSSGQSNMAMRILDAVRANLVALSLDLDTVVAESGVHDGPESDSSSARSDR